MEPRIVELGFRTSFGQLLRMLRFGRSKGTLRLLLHFLLVVILSPATSADGKTEIADKWNSRSKPTSRGTPLLPHFQKVALPLNSGAESVKGSEEREKAFGYSEDDGGLEWLFDEKKEPVEKQDYNTLVANFGSGATGTLINGVPTTATVVNKVMRTAGAIAALIVFLIQPVFDSIVARFIVFNNGRRGPNHDFGDFRRTRIGQSQWPGVAHHSSIQQREGHGRNSFHFQFPSSFSSHANPNSYKFQSSTTWTGLLDAVKLMEDGGKKSDSRSSIKSERDGKSKWWDFKLSAGTDQHGNGPDHDQDEDERPTARGILDADRCIEKISCDLIGFTNGRNFVMDFVRERYSDVEGQRPGKITKRILKTVAKQNVGDCGQYYCNPISFLVRLFIYIMDWNTLFKA